MSARCHHATPSATVNVPQKPGQAAYTYPYPYQANLSRVSTSPPEHAASSTGTGVASYSAAGSRHASSDYDSSSGANSVDLLHYMHERLATAYDPVPLDKSLAQQAQTSGQINAQTRQLLELQALAQQRLAAVRVSFAEGIKNAKEVQRDLQWTQKRVTAINQRAARKYPTEYQIASQQYPTTFDS